MDKAGIALLGWRGCFSSPGTLGENPAVDIDPFPTITGTSVRSLTASQMRAVDEIAIEYYGLSLLQMMENAGGRLAELAIRRFAPGRVVVLAGLSGDLPPVLFLRGPEVTPPGLRGEPAP